jgi:hypothetical protein
MAIDQSFHDYFAALDRAGGEDRCYLCRRTPAEVKLFFGFGEDGTPLDSEKFGIEDITLERQDVMSYLGLRPVCAVCQLNHDALFAMGEHEVLERVAREMEHKREDLWPDPESSD